MIIGSPELSRISPELSQVFFDWLVLRSGSDTPEVTKVWPVEPAQALKRLTGAAGLRNYSNPSAYRTKL
jgi:hypothetical protein